MTDASTAAGPHAPTCPLPRERIVDRYFLEHRAKLLDLAAFLDRLDRAPPAPRPTMSTTPATPPVSESGGGESDGTGITKEADNRERVGLDDFRVVALRRAIELLIDGQSDRTRRVLELFSDPTDAPIPAASAKGAAGAWDAPTETHESPRDAAPSQTSPPG